GGVARARPAPNPRLLEKLGITGGTTPRGARQDYFQIASDPYARLIRASLERMRKSRDLVARTRARLPKQQAGSQKRLKDLEEFYRATMYALSTVARSYAAPVA